MASNTLAYRSVETLMTTKWYYRVMNDVIGPLTPSQLLERVRTGQVKHDTLVRKDDSQWVPANQVNGLFDAINHNATRRLCPYCGHLVDMPPTVCPGCSRSIVVTVSSRLADVGKKKSHARKMPSPEEQAEALRKRTERLEIVRYALLFVLWIVLLAIAPHVTRLASEGGASNGMASVIWGVTATAIVAIVYFILARFM